MDEFEFPSTDELEAYLKSQQRTYDIVDHVLAVARYILVAAIVLVVWFAFN